MKASNFFYIFIVAYLASLGFAIVRAAADEGSSSTSGAYSAIEAIEDKPAAEAENMARSELAALSSGLLLKGIPPSEVQNISYQLGQLHTSVANSKMGWFTKWSLKREISKVIKGAQQRQQDLEASIAG